MRKANLVLILPLALLAGLLVTHSGTPARAEGDASTSILTVCPDGPPACDYSIIQEAVDAAAPGDEVWLATGVYTGVNDYGPDSQVVYLSKTLTLRGGYSPDFGQQDPFVYATTLDAQGLGRAAYVTGPVSVTLEGLGLTGGYADAGGGLRAAGATVSLWRCQIRDNVAEDSGGGLYFVQSSARLDGVTVSGNLAFSRGSGLFCYQSDLTLDNGLVVDNLGVPGGGVVATNSDLRLRHTTLARNGWGLVIDQQGVPHSTAWLTNTVLVSHTGGVYAAAGTTLTLEATLWGNQTDWAGLGVIVTGTHNWWEDPGFVDPAAGNYHLGPDSAALDRGMDVGLSTDIDGDPRPLGPAPDLGADEYVPCYPLTGLTIAGPTGGHPGLYTFTTTYQPPTATLPISYSWRDGGTFSVTVRDLDVGAHTLIVTAANCQDAVVTATHTLTIEPPCQPLAGVEITGPVSGYPGVYTFTTSYQTPTATLPISYSWNDGSILSVTVRSLDVGVHTLMVTATNCQDAAVTGTHIITVSAPPPTCPVPLTGLSLAGPVTGTTGIPYVFTASPVPTDATEPITYTWTPPPDDDRGDAVTYTWHLTGSRILTVSAESCSGLFTATHSITLSAPPPPCYGLAGVGIAGPTALMVGGSARYTAVVTPGTASLPISYTWSPEPETGQGTGLVTYHWPTVGDYAIVLSVENCPAGMPSGYASPVSATLSVSVAPMTLYLPLVLKQMPPVPVDDAPDTCPGYEAQVGYSYRENADRANDQDWFSFDVVSGTTYVVQTGSLEAQADTVLQLWSGDCADLLAENDDVNYPADLSSRITWTATETGSLAAMVRNRPWDVFGPGTGYTLSIEEQ